MEWSIGTTPFGSDISSGTASSIQTTYWGGASGWAISEDDFAISGSVAAGRTYYFTLQDADGGIGTSPPNVGWDVNNGPSVAYYQRQYPIGPFPSSEPPASESFQLYGTSSVPEPSTLLAGAMLFLPFGASTVRMLRKRQVA